MLSVIMLSVIMLSVMPIVTALYGDPDVVCEINFLV
jgi:hypothetical protein